ncbi:hypothetical protein [Candidatus Cardinium hertigii]|uniref:Uncharacterized protein n=1 Tax=Candidatus Cardinium hertigii TaxID=247481 RepID=A0A3N2QAU7_9BACT|nr:hypothetical protein [Candidatus Cardinium hertigii]ROT46915.1 hypothetical protein EDM02_05045 [Candidatus Cardinium hertigii]
MFYLGPIFTFILLSLSGCQQQTLQMEAGKRNSLSHTPPPTGGVQMTICDPKKILDQIGGFRPKDYEDLAYISNVWGKEALFQFLKELGPENKNLLEPDTFREIVVITKNNPGSCSLLSFIFSKLAANMDGFATHIHFKKLMKAIACAHSLEAPCLCFDKLIESNLLTISNFNKLMAQPDRWDQACDLLSLFANWNILNQGTFDSVVDIENKEQLIEVSKTLHIHPYHLACTPLYAVTKIYQNNPSLLFPNILWQFTQLLDHAPAHSLEVLCLCFDKLIESNLLTISNFNNLMAQPDRWNEVRYLLSLFANWNILNQGTFDSVVDIKNKEQLIEIWNTLDMHPSHLACTPLYAITTIYKNNPSLLSLPPNILLAFTQLLNRKPVAVSQPFFALLQEAWMVRLLTERSFTRLMYPALYIYQATENGTIIAFNCMDQFNKLAEIKDVLFDSGVLTIDLLDELIDLGWTSCEHDLVSRLVSPTMQHILKTYVIPQEQFASLLKLNEACWSILEKRILNSCAITQETFEVLKNQHWVTIKGMLDIFSFQQQALEALMQLDKKDFIHLESVIKQYKDAKEEIRLALDFSGNVNVLTRLANTYIEQFLIKKDQSLQTLSDHLKNIITLLRRYPLIHAKDKGVSLLKLDNERLSILVAITNVYLISGFNEKEYEILLRSDYQRLMKIQKDLQDLVGNNTRSLTEDQLDTILQNYRH